MAKKKQKPVTTAEKVEDCRGCGCSDPKDLTECPHCGNQKCRNCDMGDDVECGNCPNEDDEDSGVFDD